jgi:hypothetical protein
MIAALRGVIRGMENAVSSVQSNMGAWIAAVIGVGAVMVAVLAIATGFLGAGFFSNSERIDHVGDRVGAMDVRLGSIEAKQEILPQQVAQQVVQQLQSDRQPRATKQSH